MSQSEFIIRKFQKLGTDWCQPEKKFWVPGTSQKKIVGTDGYHVLARKKFWVALGTGQIYNDADP